MRDRRKKVAMIDYDARKRAFKTMGLAVFAFATMLGVFTVKDTFFQPTPSYAAIAVNPPMPTVSHAPQQTSRPIAQHMQPPTPAQIERIRRLMQQSAAASATQPASAEDQSGQYVLDAR